MQGETWIKGFRLLVDVSYGLLDFCSGKGIFVAARDHQWAPKQMDCKLLSPGKIQAYLHIFRTREKETFLFGQNGFETSLWPYNLSQSMEKDLVLARTWKHENQPQIRLDTAFIWQTLKSFALFFFCFVFQLPRLLT